MISTKCDKCKDKIGVGVVMSAKVKHYHVLYVKKL